MAELTDDEREAHMRQQPHWYVYSPSGATVDFLLRRLGEARAEIARLTKAREKHTVYFNNLLLRGRLKP